MDSSFGNELARMMFWRTVILIVVVAVISVVGWEAGKYILHHLHIGWAR